MTSARGQLDGQAPLCPSYGLIDFGVIPPLPEQAAGGLTIIQIVGDGNRIVSGQFHLILTCYHSRREVRSQVDQLSPYVRAIRLVGQDGERAALRHWLASERLVSIRVLTGHAESGKARLALGSLRDPNLYK